jgi:hypothetical protein
MENGAEPLAMLPLRSHFPQMPTIPTAPHHLGISGSKASKTSSGYKATAHINRRVTQSIFRACDYAIAIGLPLNFYIVINLHETTAACATSIFADIRHRFRDWLNYRRRKGCEDTPRPTYIYALENPNGTHPHANWAIHIPPQLETEFRRKLRQWVMKAQDVCGIHDCHVQPINQDYAKKLAKYIVKATDPAFIAHFYLGDEAADQGTIYGKRAGVSPSLGHAVRREANFRPQRRTYWQHAA